MMKALNTIGCGENLDGAGESAQRFSGDFL